jgi:hypothetical protein
VVTTVCFVDDVSEVLGEVHRVLVSSGVIVTGYVDADSDDATGNDARKTRFTGTRSSRRPTSTRTDSTRRALRIFEFIQTVFDEGEGEGEDEDGSTPTRVEGGYGDGSFVAVVATRSSKPD